MMDDKVGNSSKEGRTGDAYIDVGSHPEEVVGVSLCRESNKVRRGFIRKVLAILFCQLCVTMAIAVLFYVVPVLNNFCAKHSWFFWVSFLAAFAVLLVLVCKPRLAQTYPRNYCALCSFTVLEAVFIGVVCAQNNTVTVLYSISIVAIISIALIAFATQTKIDFTSKGSYLYAALWVFIFGGAVLYIEDYSMNNFFSVVGGFIFSMFIVYDAQLILGGNHRLQFGVDDYIFAALNLYLDIINLFLITLTGASNFRR